MTLPMAAEEKNRHWSADYAGLEADGTERTGALQAG
jgi:hypothetical protein